MKLHTLLATLLLTGSAFAQTTPTLYPMPAPVVIPPGANTATYPAPRMDWTDRVALLVQKAHNVAASTQLVFDGDSITDGWQGTGRDVWNHYYGKLNAFDFGIGGDRTQHVLWRLAQGQADGFHPKLIALMIGTNNIPGGNTNDQIVDGVKAIIAEYQKRCPDAVILLQGIFPRGETPDYPFRSRIKDINQNLSKLGDGKKVIFVDFGDKFLNPDGTMSKEIMPDFLHPSAKGYKIWAEAIQPIIDKYFPAK